MDMGLKHLEVAIDNTWQNFIVQSVANFVRPEDFQLSVAEAKGPVEKLAAIM